MNGRVTPITRAPDYGRVVPGPFVGAHCSSPGCAMFAKFVLTPFGEDPAQGRAACGRHIPMLVPAILTAHGTSVVVQEIPRLTRIRKPGR